MDLTRWQQLFRNPGIEPATLQERTFLLVRQAIPEENHDSSAAQEAVRTARQDSVSHKDDPVDLVLEATARAVIARNSSNLLEKIGQAGQALSLFDKAVLLAQGREEEWFVRLFRASTFVYLPDFFQKKKIAETDLAWVAETLGNQESLKSLVPVVMFYQGEFVGRQHRDAEAHRLWNRVLADAAAFGLPESIYEVRKARDRLGG
jgi:hypothetical protein